MNEQISIIADELQKGSYEHLKNLKSLEVRLNTMLEDVTKKAKVLADKIKALESREKEIVLKETDANSILRIMQTKLASVKAKEVAVQDNLKRVDDQKEDVDRVGKALEEQKKQSDTVKKELRTRKANLELDERSIRADRIAVDRRLRDIGVQKILDETREAA